jgi:hypothetical protein
MYFAMDSMSRRQFVQRVGVASLGLLAGCKVEDRGVKSLSAEPSHASMRSADSSVPAMNPVSGEPPGRVRERRSVDILGGHDTPNPGGSRDIRQFVSDLQTLGMKTTVSIDPSPQLIEALKRAGIRLIVRLVQEDNVFQEQNVMWTLNKLQGVPDLRIQPFNEPNLEGIAVSPEDHIRHQFLPAARMILPAIVPKGGKLLLTPLATHAPFQGVPELEGYKRMLQALVDEVQFEDDWMWNHLVIGAHAYSYHLGDDRIWTRLEEMAAITEQTIGAALPIEVTEAGLNIDYQGQYDDEQILSETIRIVKSAVPSSLCGYIQSFCLWLTANYAQRDPRHQQLGESHKARQEELDRFENAALRRLDGVTSTFQALASLAATSAN